MSALNQRRQSRAALWCQRIAVFLIPYFLVVIVGQRWGFIDTPSVLLLLGLGLLLILLSLGLGAIGFRQLWLYGHKGGMQSVRGMTLSMLMFLPFGWYGWLAFTLPPLHDITTDKFEPPKFVAALKLRSPEMNELGDFSQEQIDVQETFYPQIGSRRYSTSTDRVFTSVVELIKARGWKITRKIGEEVPLTTNPIDVEGSAPKHPKAPKTIVPTPRPAPSNPDNTETAKTSGRDLTTTYVEAVARSTVMGFSDDVVVRIIDEDEGALVDMRSASRWGVHDLGTNANRIKSFLRDLDAALAGISGEG